MRGLGFGCHGEECRPEMPDGVVRHTSMIEILSTRGHAIQQTMEIHMRTRAVVGIASVIVGLGSISACGSSDGGTAADGAAAVVNVGMVPVAEAIPLELGISKGFFKKQNLTIKKTVGQGGPALIAGVSSGSLDVGMAAGPPLIAARSSNVPVVALLGATATGDNEAKPYLALVVKKGSSITSVADLAGKTIAVNGLKSNSELYVRADVAARGGNPASLKFIEVPWPDQQTALEKGRVDAVALAEPFLTPTLAAGAKVLLPFASDILGPDGPITYWFTSERQIKDKKDVIDRFDTAMTAASEYAQAHPEEARAAYASFAKLQPGQADEITLPKFGPPVDMANFEKDAGLMVKYGFLPKAPNLDGIIR